MSQESLMHLLIAPITTEKTMRSTGADSTYAFSVVKEATKDNIRKAVELMFNTKVNRVRVVNVKSKPKRFGQIQGRSKAWKKAYVTLKSGEQIDFSGFQA
ncbi:MAG: 50S ribosomal protein L23 [Gammaproteobacteria bacterium]|nr:50S ribosomal protein L23 [Gammaproteobacteria bacterium]